MRFVNIGAEHFFRELKKQGAETIRIDWKPRAGGDIDSLRTLEQLSRDPRIDRANRTAVERIQAGAPLLVDIAPAADAIPGMHQNRILHAGPPIEWERMCGPMKGAVVGALLFEGMASDPESAFRLAQSGQIEFMPAHAMHAVGPMAGVVSASMPVHIIENRAFGNRAYCTVNEGLGKVLRFGAYSEDVIERLRFIRDEFMPVMKDALARIGKGIDLRLLIAQSLQMGDECHNRNKAATSLFLREILPAMLRANRPLGQIESAVRFIAENDHYFLNLSMPAAKSILDAAANIEHSTLVTAMSRNGVDFGIRVSGLGDRWFTAPAEAVDGMLFPGFEPRDANPDLGDSAITETLGIGGFSMAAAPAITQFVGGDVETSIEYTKSMYDITLCEFGALTIPALDFAGIPSGIDIRKVLDTGVLPVINTGIAHREAGVGQIGAGIVHPPLACFTEAIKAFGEVLTSRSVELPPTKSSPAL